MGTVSSKIFGISSKIFLNFSSASKSNFLILSNFKFITSTAFVFSVESSPFDLRIPISFERRFFLFFKDSFSKISSFLSESTFKNSSLSSI